MKNKLILLFSCAFFIVGLFLCFSSFKTEAAQNNKVWEYKFEFSANEKKANDLGAQGWELVAIQSTGAGLGNNVPTYVYKREKK